MPNEHAKLLQPTTGNVKERVAHGEEGSAVSSFLGLATTMMGACILTLPGTVAAVGVLPAILLFVLAGTVTYVSFEIIRICCDAVGEFSYESLSLRLLGPSGVWMIRLMTLVLLFGAMVTYMVIAMDLFEPFLGGLFTRTTIGWVFTVIAIPLCLPETIHELRYANLMVILCILYILVALCIRTAQDDPELTAHMGGETNVNASQFSSEVSAIAYALPIITLSFACQLNVPRAYQEIHDKPAMRYVHQTLMGFAVVCYLLFALLGYFCFHGHPPSDILTGFASDDMLINGARICLGASMVLKTPMTFQPLRQVVELCFLGHNRESLSFRTVITVFFMVLAHFLATLSRDLGVVFSFIGALAGNILCITVPGMFLYEVSKNGYIYESHLFYTRRLAWVLTYTGIIFSITSLSYLAYSAF